VHLRNIAGVLVTHDPRIAAAILFPFVAAIVFGIIRAIG
jgi:hypothetical protein